MIESKGDFLFSIQEFLNRLNEFQELLKGYNVISINELKQKIENKELPEHPSYEDYLDCLSLYELLKESKSRIIDEVNGVDIEALK